MKLFVAFAVLCFGLPGPVIGETKDSTFSDLIDSGYKVISILNVSNEMGLGMREIYLQNDDTLFVCYFRTLLSLDSRHEEISLGCFMVGV